MDIIIADDHALVREGLRPFLMELAADAQVFEAENFERARVLAKSLDNLSLIILDLDMPGMNALSGARLMMETHPEVPVVILSGTHDQPLIMRAFNLGIAGFIPKSAGSEVMMNALNLILSGGRFMPSNLALFDGSSHDNENATRHTKRPDHDDTPQIAKSHVTRDLSNREWTVLELLVGGMTNKEIALDLDLKEATVKIHVKNIYRKMGVANRAQAVRMALQPDWNITPQRFDGPTAIRAAV